MSKKKAKDIISIDALIGLPSTSDISNALSFTNELQTIENMREFHARNIAYTDFETALTGMSGAFFNGRSSRKYITKLKKLKPSKSHAIEVDFI